MITLDGEITEVTCPPNRAHQFRAVTIWLSESEEHVELTLGLSDFQDSGMGVGDKISIKVEKKFDIDSLTKDLLKM
ncbi:MAG: hypothetical protein ACE5E9_03205 [Nitrospinaceae bacterium]